MSFHLITPQEKYLLYFAIWEDSHRYLKQVWLTQMMSWWITNHDNPITHGNHNCCSLPWRIFLFSQSVYQCIVCLVGTVLILVVAYHARMTLFREDVMHYCTISALWQTNKQRNMYLLLMSLEKFNNNCTWRVGSWQRECSSCSSYCLQCIRVRLQSLFRQWF